MIRLRLFINRDFHLNKAREQFEGTRASIAEQEGDDYCKNLDGLMKVGISLIDISWECV